MLNIQKHLILPLPAIIFIIITTLVTLGLERKIYKNKNYSKSKRVIHAFPARGLHASMLGYGKLPTRKTGMPRTENAEKLAHFSL